MLCERRGSIAEYIVRSSLIDGSLTAAKLQPRGWCRVKGHEKGYQKYQAECLDRQKHIFKAPTESPHVSLHSVNKRFSRQNMKIQAFNPNPDRPFDGLTVLMPKPVNLFTLVSAGRCIRSLKRIPGFG